MYFELRVITSYILTDEMSLEEVREKVFGLEETRSQIIKHFQPGDLKTMSLVSRHWNTSLQASPLWQAFQIKLTAENCKEILNNENVHYKRIPTVIDVSTNTETFHETSRVLSVLRELKDDPKTLLKKLRICINCNSELVESQLQSITTNIEELAFIISSMEGVEIVFQSKDELKFNHNQMIGFIIAFMLDSLVKLIKDKESTLRRLDLRGRWSSQCAQPWGC